LKTLYPWKLSPAERIPRFFLVKGEPARKEMGLFVYLDFIETVYAEFDASNA
jgi:hypothetical protein